MVKKIVGSSNSVIPDTYWLKVLVVKGCLGVNLFWVTSRTFSSGRENNCAHIILWQAKRKKTLKNKKNARVVWASGHFYLFFFSARILFAYLRCYSFILLFPQPFYLTKELGNSGCEEQLLGSQPSSGQVLHGAPSQRRKSKSLQGLFLFLFVWQ